MQNEIERVWVIGGSRVYKVFCIKCVQKNIYRLMSRKCEIFEI